MKVSLLAVRESQCLFRFSSLPTSQQDRLSYPFKQLTACVTSISLILSCPNTSSIFSFFNSVLSLRISKSLVVCNSRTPPWHLVLQAHHLASP
ncbi:Uncharacterized protein HZ326_13383 [Fusarium oxysporum f. sp. albedinis]|nr:Uncharacterized protein HZ326_13383 [Fusarium oxysporum f. sp. albedinis]